ncbi:MAG: HAD-IB family phosphatase [Magnetococcales bacterium]|nr:HAD-IB family phosphatase [Magnetococcales bacterium]
MTDETTHRPEVAVFDINGTLIEKNVGVTFVKHLFFRGRMRWLTVVKILLLYPWVRLGLLDFRYAILMGGWALDGLTPEQARQEADLCFEETMRHRLYKKGLEEIAACRACGMRIVLATGGVASIARPFGRLVQADDVIAAESEQHHGRLGPKLQQPIPYQEGKRDQVLAHIKEAVGDSARITFYTDKAKDLPLLEAVDVPVAVNADDALVRYVKGRGGRVVFFV